MVATPPNAGWYQDPTSRHEHRYWDGSTWTEHAADHGEEATDPLGGASLPPPAESGSGALHAGLDVSFRGQHERTGRGDMAKQYPEVESQDGAYRRWQETVGDPAVVQAVTARYREGLQLENEAANRHRKKAIQSGMREALAVYESLLAEQPGFANAACREAYVWQILGSIPDSLTASQRASAADPEFEMPYFIAGLALKAQGRRDDAEVAYRKVIALNDRFAAARDNLGLLLVEKGDFDGAIKQFQAILQTFPDPRDARVNLENAQARSPRR